MTGGREGPVKEKKSRKCHPQTVVELRLGIRTEGDEMRVWLTWGGSLLIVEVYAQFLR